jgi:hypothetical protein
MRILLAGDTLEVVTYEQFQLARRANISIDESSCLPVFEYEAYIDMLLRDLKNEQESISRQQATLRF